MNGARQHAGTDARCEDRQTSAPAGTAVPVATSGPTASPTPQAAAEIYPPQYWSAMIKPPAASDFPGTGPTGNGISPQFATQQLWSFHAKDCLSCREKQAIALFWRARRRNPSRV